nr:hypothetical protein CFP56_17653 [Quercus suber]POE61249.1 hypothetical protein CFP56_75952 [Quercus suber]
MVTRPCAIFVMGTMFGALVTGVAMERYWHHHEGEGRRNWHCPREDLRKKTSASASASPGEAEEAVKTIPIN